MVAIECRFLYNYTQSVDSPNLPQADSKATWCTSAKGIQAPHHLAMDCRLKPHMLVLPAHVIFILPAVPDHSLPVLRYPWSISDSRSTSMLTSYPGVSAPS